MTSPSYRDSLPCGSFRYISQLCISMPVTEILAEPAETGVLVWTSLIALVIDVIISWVLVYEFEMGVIGAAIALDISWWVLVLAMLGFTVWGGCRQTWTGFSMQAFSGLCELTRLSAAAGIMIWYCAFASFFILSLL